MTTSTHREIATFPIEAGATRFNILEGFDTATREIEERAKEQNDATVLWDMLRVEYREEERDETHNIVGDVAYESTWPAAVVVTVPVVVTS